MRMYHTGTKDLDPAGAFTYRTSLAIAERARYIDLNGWFCKREIRRTETNLTAIAEHLVCHCSQCAFQISQCDLLTDNQSFTLHELMGMRRIIIISSVYLARADELDRRFTLCLFKFTHLHGCCMSP